MAGLGDNPSVMENVNWGREGTARACTVRVNNLEPQLRGHQTGHCKAQSARFRRHYIGKPSPQFPETAADLHGGLNRAVRVGRVIDLCRSPDVSNDHGVPFRRILDLDHFHGIVGIIFSGSEIFDEPQCRL